MDRHLHVAHRRGDPGSGDRGRDPDPRLRQVHSKDWLDLTINGLALGGIYALIALGYTLVYGILRMINFAHGDVFMTGPFIAYFVATAFDEAGYFSGSP